MLYIFLLDKKRRMHPWFIDLVPIQSIRSSSSVVTWASNAQTMFCNSYVVLILSMNRSLVATSLVRDLEPLFRRALWQDFSFVRHVVRVIFSVLLKPNRDSCLLLGDSLFLSERNGLGWWRGFQVSTSWILSSSSIKMISTFETQRLWRRRWREE